MPPGSGKRKTTGRMQAVRAGGTFEVNVQASFVMIVILLIEMRGMITVSFAGK